MHPGFGHGLDALAARLNGHGRQHPVGSPRQLLQDVTGIGLVGKAPGKYNLYLGAAFDGSRLSKLYAQDVNEERIIALLEPIFMAYAKKRKDVS